jgi:hypothetical protein
MALMVTAPEQDSWGPAHLARASSERVSWEQVWEQARQVKAPSALARLAKHPACSAEYGR